jgi:hypothetical protein
MGYLTTFTIYNDGVDLVKDHAQDFANKILKASRSSQAGDIAIGSFCNLVRVQKSRHADECTMYVHMGNCVTELNPYSQETKNLAERHPEFFKKLVKFAEQEVRELKALIKKTKQ